MGALFAKPVTISYSYKILWSLCSCIRIKDAPKWYDHIMLFLDIFNEWHQSWVFNNKNKSTHFNHNVKFNIQIDHGYMKYLIYTVLYDYRRTTVPQWRNRRRGRAIQCTRCIWRRKNNSMIPDHHKTFHLYKNGQKIQCTRWSVPL